MDELFRDFRSEPFNFRFCESIYLSTPLESARLMMAPPGPVQTRLVGKGSVPLAVQVKNIDSFKGLRYISSGGSMLNQPDSGAIVSRGCFMKVRSNEQSADKQTTDEQKTNKGEQINKQVQNGPTDSQTNNRTRKQAIHVVFVCETMNKNK